MRGGEGGKGGGTFKSETGAKWPLGVGVGVQGCDSTAAAAAGVEAAAAAVEVGRSHMWMAPVKRDV